MLRIGFDAKRLFNNATGLGNYSRTLVRGLKEFYPENSYTLFSPKTIPSDETQDFFSAEYSICNAGRLPAWLWRSYLIKGDIKKANLDIFHGLSHELPIGINRVKTSSIVTIHDVISKIYPQDFSPVDCKIFDYKIKYACEHADRIVAISESTKSDLIYLYGVPEDKISVIYQTCNDAFKQVPSTATIDSIVQTYHLPQQFLLYVGTINERKNLLSIVEAMYHLKGKCDIPLVVVGDGKEYKQKVVDYVKKHNLESSVLFAPYIKNQDLPVLYHQAKIFMYPSRYEGFGIPIIEALYSKTPVITTRLSSLPEAAGAGAHYVDPDEPETIAEGILKILSKDDYREHLVTAGFNHVQQFNKQTISKILMGLYERTVKEA